MTALRISVLAAGFALFALAAHAQTDEPPADDRTVTGPPRSLDGAPEPAQDAQDTGSGQSTDEPPVDDSQYEPTPSAAAPEQAAPALVAVPNPPSVQVDTLGSLDGPAVGLLDPANGGFDSNMWAGSARGQIETLLSRIPLASPDSTVRALARRVILSKAESPAGSAPRALVTVRLEKLLDAGLIDEAGAVAAMSVLKDDPDFARVQADAILTAGRVEVCGDQTATRTTDGGLFWLQLRAYCATASGDTAAAELTRNVVDAQGQTDAAYNTLVDDVLSGAKKPPGKIAKPTAMHLFLLRKAGLPVTGDIAAKLGTAANLLALRDPGNSPEVRLAAAERIVRTGAVSIAELKSIADAQTIPAARLNDAVTDAAKMPFLAGQLLLRRAAQLESRHAVKTELVHAALVLGEKAGLPEIAAGLQADVAASIDATGAPRALAPRIAMALLMAGKMQAAAQWLGTGDGPAATALLALVSGKETGAQDALRAIATHLAGDPQYADPYETVRGAVAGRIRRVGPPHAGGCQIASGHCRRRSMAGTPAGSG